MFSAYSSALLLRVHRSSLAVVLYQSGLVVLRSFFRVGLPWLALEPRHQQPMWMIRRIKAEARLASEQKEHWQEAANELTELLKDDLPRIHRAEVLCNLGLAYDSLGSKKESLEALRKAIEVNPFLEAATNLMTSA
jgi:tetratricopeptide (TPR) repeat protein